MKLRGHHLLCLLGYQGEGYSNFFNENMRKLADIYQNLDINIRIEITSDTDEVCAACPSQKGIFCSTDSSKDHRIRALDHRVLSALLLQQNRTYNKNTIIERIRERVKPNDLQTICHHCEWLSLGYCQDAIRRLTET